MTPLSDLAFLRAVKAKIATRETWTQGAYGRDANGRVVSYTSPRTVCWCWEGAAFAVGGETGHWRMERLAHLTGGDLLHINDTEGFDAVHKVLDAAVRAQEGEQE